jgi:hypothetical protein
MMAASITCSVGCLELQHNSKSSPMPLKNILYLRDVRLVTSTSICIRKEFVDSWTLYQSLCTYGFQIMRQRHSDNYFLAPIIFRPDYLCPDYLDYLSPDYPLPRLSLAPIICSDFRFCPLIYIVKPMPFPQTW